MPEILPRWAFDLFATDKPEEVLEAALLILQPNSDELKRSAAESILQTVVGYQNMVRAGSTRWSDVHRELRRIGQKSRELHFALSESSLQTVTLLVAEEMLAVDLSAEHSVEGSLVGKGFAEAPLLRLLERVRETTENLTKTLPRDPGGRGGGIPEPDYNRRTLVRFCMILFEKFRPGRATATLGGDFMGFVTLVWELASGEPDVDLARPVEVALKQARLRVVGDVAGH